MVFNELSFYRVFCSYHESQSDVPGAEIKSLYSKLRLRLETEIKNYKRPRKRIREKKNKKQKNNNNNNNKITAIGHTRSVVLEEFG